MSNKTINQALKDLYTGLGGDPQALAHNSTCSDYIEDLESAIKGAASGAQIDDTTPSETKVYSSAKTEALIEAIPSLPSVAVGDIGEALIVESDGEGGAQWGKGAISVPQNCLIITATASNDVLTLTSDMTPSQIDRAIKTDHKLVVLIDTTNKRVYYPTATGVAVTSSSGGTNFIWSGFVNNEDFTNNIYSIKTVDIRTGGSPFPIYTKTVTLTTP